MALVISTGMLNQRIQFQARTQGKDADGGITDNWANVTDGEVWARRNNLSGNVKTATDVGGQQREARVEFTVRWQAQLEDDTLRILHKGQVFQVQHCNNYMQRNQWLIFTCGTGVNDGR